MLVVLNSNWRRQNPQPKLHSKSESQRSVVTISHHSQKVHLYGTVSATAEEEQDASNIRMNRKITAKISKLF